MEAIGLFAAQLREGSVVRLLTLYERTVPIFAVRSASRWLSTKVRIFIEPPWRRLSRSVPSSTRRRAKNCFSIRTTQIARCGRAVHFRRPVL
jgi:hypothetical protein